MALDWIAIGSFTLFASGAIGLADAGGLPYGVDVFLNAAAVLSFALILVAIMLITLLRLLGAHVLHAHARVDEQDC